MTRLLLKVSAVALLGAAALAPVDLADATTPDILTRPVMCGSGDVARPSDGEIVMVDGFGAGSIPIDTQVPEAQAWFDHGVKLRWAFEHSESVRAFQKARRLDPTCGMCAWGEAWAMGPNINGGGYEDEVQVEALKIAREARRLGRTASPLQRQMMDALVRRYSGREGGRATGFARSMDQLAVRHPADGALAAITADALMLAADAWWSEDGKPGVGVPRAMELLEGALARDPDNTAAIHLYIHLTEWSPNPNLAIPHADRLESLTPGASHLVHMPSHSYYRVGRYKDAMTANVKAVALDHRYDRLAAPPGGVPGMALHGHNIHFGMGGALMAGGAERGLELADGFMATYPNIPASNQWRQVVANNAYAIYGRFGDAAKVEGLADPGEERPQMRISWRYARGEAAARRGDAAAVRAEAQAIRDVREAMTFSGAQVEYRQVFAELPLRVLEGRAAMIEGNFPAAIAAFTRAVGLQASVDMGGDPPAWWYPTERSLAAALLASGDASGARARVLTVLEDWPSDPLSLFVLAAAEAALGHQAEAASARTRSQVEWLGGAMNLAGV